MSAPANPETVLLRLFRCMAQGEQERLIRAALELLGGRCSFDPLFRRYPTETIEEELESDDLDARLFAAWPASWPGQQQVELDNLGDPGDWLGTVLGNPVSEILFGLPLIEDGIAAEVTDDYLRKIRAEGFPLPSDFGDSPTRNGWTPEDEAQVQAEFVAFFRHWRECVLQALEQQKPKGS